MKKQLKIEQRVYVKHFSKRYTKKQDIIIKETTVKKIGRKYFYLKEYHHDKFSIETMFNVTDCTPYYKVYLSMEEIEIEKETNEIADYIVKKFKWSSNWISLGLKKLREIKNIIERNEDE